MNLKNKQKNKIPDGWEIKRLGEVFDITSSKRVFQSEWQSSGIPFYRARELVRLKEDGFVNNKLFISPKMFNEYKVKYGSPQKNDLLVTGVGTIGVTYLVGDFTDFYFKDGNVIWLKNKNLVSTKFLDYAFKTRPVRKQVVGGAAITTVATFTIDNAKNTKVLFPPLPEQKRIVGVLEVWDEGIEKLGRKIEIKENIKKGLMQQLLTGKKRLSGFSGEWDVRKLSDFKDLNHGDGDWILSENISQNGKYNIVQLGNIGFGKYVDKKLKTVSEDAFKKINGTILENGDLLINRMVDGNLNLCLFENIGDYITSVDVCWIRKNNFFDNYFLMHVMMLDYNQNKLLVLSSGSGRVRISKKNLFNKFEFKLPTLKEQKAIAEVLTTADEEVEALQKKLEILKDQKKFLLNNLVTGNIRVSE